ncbi:MAG: polysaccharide biosynthesis C-terminal domain-containing protein [Kofleriaceae bacterium]|nr:polysaccharide biosynthesis C-terminal domain-containing protein [Kofleriaceae bacterium]
MSVAGQDRFASDRRRLRRAIAFNVIGTVGKALWPLFLAVAARRHGTSVLGTFLVLQAAVEIAHGLVASGYVDALHRFTARRPGDPLPAGFHALVRGSLGAVLATEATLVACAVIAGLAAGLAHELVAAIALMGIALVLQGGVAVALAPCTAMLRNEPEVAIRQVLAPALVNLLVIILPAPNLLSLATAFAVAYGTCALAALVVARRQYGFSLVLGDPTPPPPYRRFAILQGVNVGLWTSIYSLDTILLALFVQPALVALYRAGSEVTRALYLIRVQFSGAFAPLAARYLADQELAPLARLLDSLATTITWIGVIAAGAIVLLREPLLALALDTSPAETGFVVVLVAGQVLLCATSLTGNTLAMRGLASMLVKNGALMLVVNTVLNVVLVPSIGLTGAALGTLGAMALSQGLQMYELRVAVGIRYAPRGPLIAIVLGIGLLLGVLPLEAHLAAGSYVAAMLVAVRFLRPRLAADAA